MFIKCVDCGLLSELPFFSKKSDYRCPECWALYEKDVKYAFYLTAKNLKKVIYDIKSNKKDEALETLNKVISKIEPKSR